MFALYRNGGSVWKKTNTGGLQVTSSANSAIKEQDTGDEMRGFGARDDHETRGGRRPYNIPSALSFFIRDIIFVDQLQLAS